MLKTTEIDFIVETLNALYPNPKPTLTHSTAFDLLVAVILSAQCTDKRVNTITPLLQPITPEHILELGEEKVRKIIFPTGYYNSKTTAIMGCAKALKGKEVPSDFKALTSLPGVGAKTAQVIQSQWFNIPAFPVDTHIHRICNRLGIADSKKNSDKTERQAKAILPKEHWHNLHMQIIFHGRETCTAFKPKCHSCPLRKICKWPSKN